MRPVGPRILNTQPTADLAIILDRYAANPEAATIVVDETAIGTLVYVAEYAVQNPFDATFAAAGLWQTLGAGTLVGAVRNFNLPASTAVTAVRLRSTGGAGSVTYWVTQTGLQ